VASLLGGALVLRSIYAILEREVEVWQGVLGITLGIALTSSAISLARSPWYFPVLALTVLAGAVAYILTVLDLRLRERRLLEQDEQRFCEAIEFDQKNSAAHAFLARVYRKQGRLHEALREMETAVALEPNEAQYRANLRALAAEIQEKPGAPICPRCESELDAGKTCPNCGWSRSTIKGLRDIRQSGVLKQGLFYGILVATGIGILGAVLRISLEFTLTLLLVGWLVCGVVLFRWFLRQEM
jgi:tetratricopeptide (TPR) repeat protein